MRAWFVVIGFAVAACGRSGFEPRQPDADPNAPDADPNAPDADPNAPDADPNAPDAAMVSCPGNYVAVAGETSRYRFVNMTATWTAAEADCEADGAGIHLVVFDDNAEINAVDAFVGDVDVWTGVTDRITEGTYLTVGGAVEPFLPWSGSEPSGDLQDCMTVEVDDNQAADQLCTQTFRALCECDGSSVVPGSF